MFDYKCYWIFIELAPSLIQSKNAMSVSLYVCLFVCLSPLSGTETKRAGYIWSKSVSLNYKSKNPYLNGSSLFYIFLGGRGLGSVLVNQPTKQSGKVSTGMVYCCDCLHW